MKDQNIQAWVESELKQRGVSNRDLREELIDHFVSDYEQIYNQNYYTDSYDNAGSEVKQEVIKNMDEVNLKKINRQANLIFYKPFIQFFILIVGLFSFWYHYQSLPFPNPDPPSIWPVEEGDSREISSTFGWRIHPIHKVKRMHKGIDIKGKIGDPVYATSDGVVSISKSSTNGFGNHVVIDHDDVYQSKYCHMSKLLVNVGDIVEQGQVIGLVGNSGFSILPHLHYEVLKDGVNVNPNAYLEP